MIATLCSSDRRNHKGLVLLEVGLALVVLVIVASTVLWAYMNSSQSQKAEAALSDLLHLRTVAQHLYGNKPGFAGLNNQMIIDYGTLPGRMVQQDGLRNAFGYPITVSSVDIDGHPDRGLSIRFDHLPHDACVLVTRLDLDASLHSFEIAGSNGTLLFERDDLPPDIPDVVRGCGETQADMTWVFR